MTKQIQKFKHGLQLINFVKKLVCFNLKYSRYFILGLVCLYFSQSDILNLFCNLKTFEYEITKSVLNQRNINKIIHDISNIFFI